MGFANDPASGVTSKDGESSFYPPEVIDLSVFGRRRVLIVDPDDSHNYQMAAEIDQSQMAHETANSIETARQKIKDFSPHILLVAVNYNEEVLATVEALAIEQHRLKFITISDAKNIETAIECFRHGAADHLTKPVDPIQLNRALNRALLAYSKDVELVRMRSVVEAHSVAMTLLDKDGRIESCNTAYDDLFGYGKGEVLGKTPRFLRVGESKVDTLSQMWGALSSGNSWAGEVPARVKNNNSVLLNVSIAPLKDAYGDVDGFAVNLVEKATSKRGAVKAKARAVESGSYDEPTGSSTEVVFKKRVGRILSTIGQAPSKPSLAVVSLSGFSDNEPHMQRLADVVLKKLNQSIEDKTHNIALVGRLSKTELGIVFPHMRVEGSQKLLRKICRRLDAAIRKVKETSTSINIDFKIGVSEMGSDEISVDAYIDLTREISVSASDAEISADSIVDAPSLTQGEAEPAAVDPQLETILQAMNEGWLRLASQKIAPVTTPFEKTTMVEMLLRIAVPDGPIMTSAQFLSVAEQHGLDIELDKWVIKSAVQWLVEQPSRRSTIEKLFINISQATMNDPQVPKFVNEVLEDAGVSGSKLCFEISEAAAMNEVDRSRRFTSRLRQLGCTFALDNFCRAGASFAMLNRVPADYIKLDGSIIEDMMTDETSHAVVKTLAEVSRSAGKEVVALRVEDVKLLDSLRALGIQYVQGFGIESPKLLHGIGESEIAQSA